MATLAIDGGAPVRTAMLPYGRHVVDEADVQAVAEVLRGAWLTTGPTVEAYEQAFAEYVGAKHAVAVNSGTAALHVAAHAAGLGPGDEAIVPALSFVATANCVRYCGATPVFADVQADTCLVDPARIESLVTERTKAILPVDYAGQPVDLDIIRDIAQRHSLVVIEDAAHALGATYRNRRIGSHAAMTVFSTHPVKHIATGEGGVVTTDDDALATRLRAFRNHGIEVDARERERRGDWVYDMGELGYNYRMPDILCALGLSQLGKLDAWLERRRDIAMRYDAAFRDVPAVMPLTQLPDRESAWHLYVIRLNAEYLRADRRQVFQALRAEGIGVNVHYLPIYWHSYYRQMGYLKGLCPVAEAQYDRLITLPLWAGMTDADAGDVVQALRKVVAAYAA